MKNNTIKFQSPIDFDALEAIPISTLAGQGLSDALKYNARTNIEAASRTELNNSCSSVFSSTMSTVYNALIPLQPSTDTSYPIVLTTTNGSASVLDNVTKQSGCYVLDNKLYSNSNEVATQTDINTVTAIAEGKTKAYITNKTNMSALNSSNDTVTISSFTDLNNTTVALSNFKVGDIVYLTDTEIPDRWVSSITKSGNTVTALVLSKMETSKVDLNSYVPKTTTIAGVDLADNITKAELQIALGYHGTAFYSGNNNNCGHDANAITDNGLYYWNSNGPSISDGMSYSDGGLYVLAYSSNWAGQIAQDYRNGRIFVRGKNNGSWTAWTRIANYNEIPTNTVSSTTITNIQVVSSMPASPDSNTLYIVQ